jgi:hypothetical protein
MEVFGQSRKVQKIFNKLGIFHIVEGGQAYVNKVLARVGFEVIARVQDPRHDFTFNC